MSERVKQQKPMRYWRIRYYFRHGPKSGKQMGPGWICESRIKPTRHLYDVFEEENYRATYEEISKEESERELA